MLGRDLSSQSSRVCLCVRVCVLILSFFGCVCTQLLSRTLLFRFHLFALHFNAQDTNHIRFTPCLGSSHKIIKTKGIEIIHYIQNNKNEIKVLYFKVPHWCILLSFYTLYKTFCLFKYTETYPQDLQVLTPLNTGSQTHKPLNSTHFR